MLFLDPGVVAGLASAENQIMRSIVQLLAVASVSMILGCAENSGPRMLQSSADSGDGVRYVSNSYDRHDRDKVAGKSCGCRGS